MTAAPVDMAQAAQVAGLSYDRFRKGWRDLVLRRGFPAPYQLRPYLWRAEALDAWVANEEARIHALITGARAPANENLAPKPPAEARVNRQRQQLRARMGVLT